jgi:hypothetical protein
MSATSVLRFINNKKFFLFAVVVFFIPFILFSFWNMPSADDYIILDLRQKHSFLGLQNWVYHNWTGRYFSTLISVAFSKQTYLLL